MTETTVKSLQAASRYDLPFLHFVLRDVLDVDLLTSLAQLPFRPPGKYTSEGTREGNESHVFATVETGQRYSALEKLRIVLLDKGVCSLLGQLTGQSLDGLGLRAAYYVDDDRFWLKPHADLPEKKLTLLAYISGIRHGDDGLDLIGDDSSRVKTLKASVNSAVLFAPSATSVHSLPVGRVKRERRSIVVNYVDGRWLNRDQIGGVVGGPS